MNFVKQSTISTSNHSPSVKNTRSFNWFYVGG